MEVTMRLLLAAAVMMGACTHRGTPGSASRDDTLTDRQRQEALSKSRLPGASGIGKALDASDSIKARTTRADSIGEDR